MRRYRAAVFILSCLLVLPASTHAIQLVDGKPVFEERLTGEVYNQRLKAALNLMPTVQELEALRTPTVGSYINHLNPGYQAESLGIDPGSVLISLDDRLLWPEWVDWGPMTRPQTLKFVTSSGESRAITVQPGTIGINHSPHRRTDLAYIRRTGRLKNVDKEVLAGMMISKDPELAETAWAHAITGGYIADDLSDSCAALIALRQNKSYLADVIAQQVPPIDAEHAYRLLPSDRVRIALTSGHIESIPDLPRRFLEKYSINAEGLKDLSSAKEAAGPVEVTPSQAAANMKRADLMSSVIPLDDPAIQASTSQYPALMSGGEFGISAGRGQFRACYFGFRQPTEDIEVVVRYTIIAEGQPTRWANIFQVALLDREYRRRHHIHSGETQGMKIRDRMTLMEVGIARDALDRAEIHLTFGNMSGNILYTYPEYDLAQPTEFEVRIVKVGEFVEAQINGTTVALSPVRETIDQQGIYLQAVGAKVKIHEVRVSSLE